jgi:hypothetical protein
MNERMRIATGAVVVALTVCVVGVTPAAAGPRFGEDRVTASEARAFERWWEGQATGMDLALAGMPVDALAEAAGRAWGSGAATRAQISAVLFSNAGYDLLAGNAAGGQGRPSPYVAYFLNNPTQLGSLGAYLLENPTYVVGPGGTQETLFSSFTGLRDSYLASLGLVDVNGRIVDPRYPYLTPFLVSQLMGPPDPLPQPSSALNVAAA